MSDAFPNPEAILNNQTFIEEARREYEQNRTGPFTIARGNQAAFLPLKTVNSKWEEVIQNLLDQDVKKYLPEGYDNNLINGFLRQGAVIADMWNRTDNAVFEFAFNGGPLGRNLQRPLSRGTITIDPADPLGNPLISYRTLSNPIDVANAIAMFKFSRLLSSQSALSSLLPIESLPGQNVTSDEDIEKALRESLFVPSFAHPSGTAAMMPEQLGGVVSSHLKIWQTTGLSIVDASIMPLIPSAHLCATVYAVAEKVGSNGCT